MTPPGTLNDDIRLLGRTLGDVIADQAGTATLDWSRRFAGPQSATRIRRV